MTNKRTYMWAANDSPLRANKSTQFQWHPTVNTSVFKHHQAHKVLPAGLSQDTQPKLVNSGRCNKQLADTNCSSTLAAKGKDLACALCYGTNWWCTFNHHATKALPCHAGNSSRTLKREPSSPRLTPDQRNCNIPISCCYHWWLSGEGFASNQTPRTTPMLACCCHPAKRMVHPQQWAQQQEQQWAQQQPELLPTHVSNSYSAHHKSSMPLRIASQEATATSYAEKSTTASAQLHHFKLQLAEQALNLPALFCQHIPAPLDHHPPHTGTCC